MAKQYDKRNKRVFLSLGSNIGDRLTYLNHAIDSLESPELTIAKNSSVYESEAWGTENLNTFYNMVIEVYTSLSALDLLNFTQRTEKAVGRLPKTTKAYENRVIDIDILFYNNEQINLPSLIVPHKYLKNRMFVLEPFREIADDLKLENFGMTINELFFDCKDEAKVLKLKSLD